MHDSSQYPFAPPSHTSAALPSGRMHPLYEQCAGLDDTSLGPFMTLCIGVYSFRVAAYAHCDARTGRFIAMYTLQEVKWRLNRIFIFAAPQLWACP